MFFLLMLMQSIVAMEQQKKQAVQHYKEMRDNLFRGMCFFNPHDSEQIKETYFEKVKEAYRHYQQEVCIGCAFCTTATAIACCAIPFACDSQFCFEYPAGWACCCIIKCGAIGVNTAIAEKIIKDCCNYWKTRKVINHVAAVEQLRPMEMKEKKVE